MVFLWFSYGFPTQLPQIEIPSVPCLQLLQEGRANTTASNPPARRTKETKDGEGRTQPNVVYLWTMWMNMTYIYVLQYVLYEYNVYIYTYI